MLAFALSAGTAYAERQRAPNFTFTDWNGNTLQEGVVAFALEFIPYTVLIDANGYIVSDAPDTFSEEGLRRAFGVLR